MLLSCEYNAGNASTRALGKMPPGSWTTLLLREYNEGNASTTALGKISQGSWTMLLPCDYKAVPDSQIPKADRGMINN